MGEKENIKIDETEKKEILKNLYSSIREELQFHRLREQQIFTWSSSLLVGLTGATLISKADTVKILSLPEGKWAAILVIIFLTIFSVRWQLIKRKFIGDIQMTISKIQIEMGAFDLSSKEEPIMPEKWKNWGKRKDSWQLNLLQGKVICTTALGIIAGFTIYIH